MSRSTLIPLIGVVITVLVVGFLFFASEPDPIIVETGDGEAVIIEQDAGAPAVADDTVVED